jgi:hypothetical protein
MVARRFNAGWMSKNDFRPGGTAEMPTAAARIYFRRADGTRILSSSLPAPPLKWRATIRGPSGTSNSTRHNRIKF